LTDNFLWADATVIHLFLTLKFQVGLVVVDLAIFYLMSSVHGHDGHMPQNGVLCMFSLVFIIHSYLYAIATKQSNIKDVENKALPVKQWNFHFSKGVLFEVVNFFYLCFIMNE